MKRLLSVCCAFGFAAVVFGVAGILGPPPRSAHATVLVFNLHDHPDGNQAPPTYGLRIDDLIGDGAFTFSFDEPGTSVMLEFDDVAGEIRIFGRAYGGKDIGTGWDTTLQGFIDIDFTYTDNILQADNKAGDPGDDLFVTAESANNAGTVTLDGWGGNQVFAFQDLAGSGGCTFIFDNDEDPKGNAVIAADPTVFSGSGWLKPPTSGARDWIFTAEMRVVPVETSTWGRVKALYGE